MKLSNLPLVSLIQLSSIAITAVFYAQSNNYKWLIAVYIFAFSHYLIGALYSRKIIFSLLASPKAYLPLALLCLTGWFAYKESFSLLLYFGLHHALSEGYLKQRFFNIQASAELLSRLQASSFWLHLSGFFLLVRSDPTLYRAYYLKPALIIFIIALTYFVYRIWHDRAIFKQTSILKLCGSELVLLGLLGVSFFYPISFLQVVFYHFTLWALLPYLRAGSPNAIRPLAFYTLLTLASLAVIVYYSPYYVPISSRYHLFEDWFILLSYAHITLSFAISNANPEWINRVFAKPMQNNLTIKTESR